MNNQTKKQTKDWKEVLVNRFQDMETIRLSDWNEPMAEFKKLEDGKLSPSEIAELMLELDLDCNHADHFEINANDEAAVCLVCGAYGAWVVEYDDDGNKWAVVEDWE